KFRLACCLDERGADDIFAWMDRGGVEVFCSGDQILQLRTEQCDGDLGNSGNQFLPFERRDNDVALETPFEHEPFDVTRNVRFLSSHVEMSASAKLMVYIDNNRK